MKSFIRNKASEKDVRDWLSENGYFGKSAEFEEVELHAIQRPGWLQIFRFEVRAKTQAGDWRQLFGAIRDDQRYGAPTIKVFVSVSARDAQLDEWSRDLIKR